MSGTGSDRFMIVGRGWIPSGRFISADRSVTVATDKEPVMVRLEPGVKEQLRSHAFNQRKSMSAVIERLVLQELELVAALEEEETEQERDLLNHFTTGEHEIEDLNAALGNDEPAA